MRINDLPYLSFLPVPLSSSQNRIQSVLNSIAMINRRLVWVGGLSTHTELRWPVLRYRRPARAIYLSLTGRSASEGKLRPVIAQHWKEQKQWMSSHFHKE